MLRRRAALLPVLALLALVPACGGDDEEDDPEAQVRETLVVYTQAIAAKDYQRLCDELFASALVEQVQSQLPCEVALQRSDLDQARSPKIEVQSVTVQGNSATAKVRASAANQPASQDTVRLVKEQGRWKIVALAS
ncbi:MAG TPA: nuclear transport factor 2 family protein [Solirubrobacteraceae bacterium]|nr:nuclear transport factor 2 family protein [Solirubrobacteraceae bacterium]